VTLFTDDDDADSPGADDQLRTDGGEPGTTDSPSVVDIYERWSEHDDDQSDEDAEIEALREAMAAAGIDVDDGAADGGETQTEAETTESETTETDDGVGQWTETDTADEEEPSEQHAESTDGGEASTTDGAASTTEELSADEPSTRRIRDSDAGTVERTVDPEVGVVVYTYGHAGGASVTTVPIEETELAEAE